MNIKRAISFGVYLYASSFIVFGLLSFIPGLELMTDGVMTNNAYIISAILNIFIVLLLAKWYFRKEEVNVSNGLNLGVIAIFVALGFDAISYLLAINYSSDGGDMFKALYGDWRLYASMAEIILLTAYAGSEFDATFTKRLKK
jgi:hypothetical protein